MKSVFFMSFNFYHCLFSSLNPIPTGAMKRILGKILARENLEMNPNLMASFCESNDGDLRQAINALQFHFVGQHGRTTTLQSSPRNNPAKKKAKHHSQSSPTIVQTTLEPTTYPTSSTRLTRGLEKCRANVLIIIYIDMTKTSLFLIYDWLQFSWNEGSLCLILSCLWKDILQQTFVLRFHFTT